MRTAPAGRFWRLLLLACVLLGMQQLGLIHSHAHDTPASPFAGKYVVHNHGGDHDGDAADDLCVVCLALDALQAAPPAAWPDLRDRPAAFVYTAVAVPPAPTFRRRAPFLSRAPPTLHC
jgi:hypothetical protein